MTPLVIGWDQVERAGRGERIIDADELRHGFYVAIGPVRFALAYRVIKRLESGRFLVEDPKHSFLPEYFRLMLTIPEKEILC